MIEGRTDTLMVFPVKGLILQAVPLLNIKGVLGTVDVSFMMGADVSVRECMGDRESVRVAVSVWVCERGYLQMHSVFWTPPALSLSLSLRQTVRQAPFELTPTGLQGREHGTSASAQGARSFAYWVTRTRTGFPKCSISNSHSPLNKAVPS